MSVGEFVPLSVHVIDENGVQERDEDGRKLEVFQGDSVNLERMLSECHRDASFHYLRFIDFYGDTVFNRLQMPPFLTEWTRLNPTNDDEREFLAQVENLASAVATQVHVYLKFFGD